MKRAWVTCLAVSTMVCLVAAEDRGFRVTKFYGSGVVAGDHAGTRGEGVKFKGFLTGAEENPPVDTATTGQFDVRFSEDLSSASFRLKVFNGTAITQAHLHCGPVGVNGPVVVFLFGMVPGGFHVNGNIAAFTLTDANVAALSPDCASRIGFNIMNLADLLTAIEQGNIYVNVHSIANPSGEIRAQLFPLVDDDDGDGDDGGEDD